MKLCFIFVNRHDAEKVKCFLAKHFTVELFSYFEYNTLYVPLSDYKEAVVQGLNFISNHRVDTAWWVDVDNQKIPVNAVPLLYAKVPESFKKYNYLKKHLKHLCKKYAEKFANRLNVSIIWYYTSSRDVRFCLIRSDDVFENHEFYFEEIIKHCLAHHHIFSQIDVSDAYGKVVTTINQNHSVQ